MLCISNGRRYHPVGEWTFWMAFPGWNQGNKRKRAQTRDPPGSDKRCRDIHIGYYKKTYIDTRCSYQLTVKAMCPSSCWLSRSPWDDYSTMHTCRTCRMDDNEVRCERVWWRMEKCVKDIMERRYDQPDRTKNCTLFFSWPCVRECMDSVTYWY